MRNNNIFIIIEYLRFQRWLGNIRISRDVVLNRIRLDGLICILKSSLHLNICQELQIFEDMYFGAVYVLIDFVIVNLGLLP